MDFGGWGMGEDLRGLRGRETIIRIYFIKKFIFNKKVLDHFFLLYHIFYIREISNCLFNSSFSHSSVVYLTPRNTEPWTGSCEIYGVINQNLASQRASKGGKRLPKSCEGVENHA